MANGAEKQTLGPEQIGPNPQPGVEGIEGGIVASESKVSDADRSMERQLSWIDTEARIFADKSNQDIKNMLMEPVHADPEISDGLRDELVQEFTLRVEEGLVEDAIRAMGEAINEKGNRRLREGVKRDFKKLLLKIATDSNVDAEIQDLALEAANPHTPGQKRDMARRKRAQEERLERI